MDTTAFLRRVRALAGQLDQETSDLTDEELLVFAEGAAVQLELRGVLVTEYTIGTVQDEAGYGVTPELSKQDGEILALQTAIDALESAFRMRLDRGEIGTSWTSGLESESTISAAQAYRSGIGRLQDMLERILAGLMVDGTRHQ